MRVKYRSGDIPRIKISCIMHIVRRVNYTRVCVGRNPFRPTTITVATTGGWSGSTSFDKIIARLDGGRCRSRTARRRLWHKF